MKDLPSTRPYLIRAMHQWCEDNGFTAYLAVAVDASVRVPRQHVVDGEIVLNASVDATGSLLLGNDLIEFKARFGGVPQDISIPVGRVHAIYARENGQGMAFPIDGGAALGSSSPEELAVPVLDASVGLSLVEPGGSTECDVHQGGGSQQPPSNSPKNGGGKRPTLTRIK